MQLKLIALLITADLVAGGAWEEWWAYDGLSGEFLLPKLMLVCAQCIEKLLAA